MPLKCLPPVLLSLWLTVIAGSLSAYAQPGAVQVRLRNGTSSNKYYKSVHLLKDGREIDHFEAYGYSVLFGAHRYRTVHRFKGLAPGTYQIKYHPEYRIDSVTEVTVQAGQTAKADICYDYFPDSLAAKPTAMDRLAVNDTLHLIFDAYHSCLNGPTSHRGLLIARMDSGYYALFHWILDSAYHRRESLADIYRENELSLGPGDGWIRLTHSDMVLVRHYLNELIYYNDRQPLVRAGATLFTARESFSFPDASEGREKWVLLKKRVSGSVARLH